MKKFLIFFSAVFLLLNLTPAGALAAPRPEKAGTEMTYAVAAKKKKGKGYKKPKKKKFLGIFKRKSSCDCPKH